MIYKQCYPSAKVFFDLNHLSQLKYLGQLFERVIWVVLKYLYVIVDLIQCFFLQKYTVT